MVVDKCISNMSDNLALIFPKFAAKNFLLKLIFSRIQIILCFVGLLKFL